MNNSPFENQGRKDLIASFKMWLVMEITSFAVFPALRLIQATDKLPNWFLMSIPLGIGGMFLIAASSQFVSSTSARQINRADKSFTLLMGQVGGWLGAAGIMYPLVVVVNEFLTEAMIQLEKRR